MIDITYYAENEMAPRFGNKFSTTYIKINARQTKKLQEHIHLVRDYIEELHHAGEINIFEPLGKEFKRTGGKDPYSMYDIVDDLIKQLAGGKDATKAMLGRWNRVFQESELDIRMVSENE